LKRDACQIRRLQIKPRCDAADTSGVASGTGMQTADAVDEHASRALAGIILGIRGDAAGEYLESAHLVLLGGEEPERRQELIDCVLRPLPGGLAGEPAPDLRLIVDALEQTKDAASPLLQRIVRPFETAELGGERREKRRINVEVARQDELVLRKLVGIQLRSDARKTGGDLEQPVEARLLALPREPRDRRRQREQHRAIAR
jgi:hypothetical protein